MTHSTVMKIFNTINELSKIGSDELVSEICFECLDKIKEITIRSIFHEDARDLLVPSSGANRSLFFGVGDLDDVLVVKGGKASFIFEIRVRLVVFKSKDFESKVLVLCWRMSKVHWELGFADELDNVYIFIILRVMGDGVDWLGLNACDEGVKALEIIGRDFRGHERCWYEQKIRSSCGFLKL